MVYYDNIARNQQTSKKCRYQKFRCNSRV